MLLTLKELFSEAMKGMAHDVSAIPILSKGPSSKLVPSDGPVPMPFYRDFERRKLQ